MSDDAVQQPIVVNYPDVAPQLHQIALLEQWCAAPPLRTQAEYEHACSALQAAKGIIQDAEGEMSRCVKPINEGLRNLRALFGRVLGPAGRAERAIKALVGNWLLEQERQRHEEEARLSAGQQKQAEKLLIRAAAAEAKGLDVKAAQLREAAQAVPTTVVLPEPPKVAGISARQLLDFEIIDAEQIPRRFLTPDLTRIRGEVRTHGLQANIPGVRVFYRQSIAASST